VGKAMRDKGDVEKENERTVMRKRKKRGSTRHKTPQTSTQGGRESTFETRRARRLHSAQNQAFPTPLSTLRKK
jgi:hypothetical protein